MEFSWHYGGGGMPQGRNLVQMRCSASRINEILLNPEKTYTGWVRKLATATYSKGLEGKEWKIEAAGSFHNGGNAA